MKTIVALVLVAVSLTLTGCATSSFNSNISACEQSIVPQQKVVGVNGVPASKVKGSIKAVNVDIPEALTTEAIVELSKEKNLDYLMVVKIDEKEEIATDNGAQMKKAGLFVLSLAASAVTRSQVNLNGGGTPSTAGYVVKTVKTSIWIFDAQGKMIRSKTTVKEMPASEAIPAIDVAAQVIAGCMS